MFRGIPLGVKKLRKFPSKCADCRLKIKIFLPCFLVGAVYPNDDKMSQELWGLNSSFPWNDEVVQELVPLAQSAPPRNSPEFEELPDFPRRLPPSSGRFRINATAVFLTYSDCAVTRDQMIEWWGRQSRVKRMIIGMEFHQNGAPHFHVTVEYEVKRDFRNERYFDILGCHPNIKTWDRATTYDQWLWNHWKYCKKDDPTPYIVGEEPMENRKRKREEHFLEAMEIARKESVRAGMQYLEDRAPYDVCTKYTQIEGALQAIRSIATRIEVPARPLSEFVNAPPIPENWHTLYLYGRTGLGKTEWACALLPEATVVRHSDQLRRCDFSKGVIFDDFSVAHWPPTAAIHLLDWNKESGINVKHSHVDIPPYTRKIVTFNQEFDRWLPTNTPYEQVEAIQRRITIVHVTERTFS